MSETSGPIELDRIASSDGTFAVLAMDQRNTLKRMFAAVGRADAPDSELIAFKADMLATLAGAASACLLDSTYGVPAAEGVDGDFGVLIAAEPSSRGDYQGEPRARRAPGQDAAWVRSLGGDALKFLVQLRVDRPVLAGELDLANEVLGVVGEVVADCRRQGLPSVIENLVYPLPHEDGLDPETRARAIIEAAQALDSLHPDLLKLEYPGSPEACRRLGDAISSPWALLSAGVAFEEFTEALRISCDEGGASGFIAGRSVWREAVGMTVSARRAFLADEGRRRLEGLLSVADGRARPWKEARR